MTFKEDLYRLHDEGQRIYDNSTLHQFFERDEFIREYVHACLEIKDIDRKKPLEELTRQ